MPRRPNRRACLANLCTPTFPCVAAQVISASRRTDIPAFFTPWFMQRVRQGFVLVRNPRNPNHVMRVSLAADDVIAIVFWSRNYQPLIPHLPELDDRGLRPYFHLTLTGYGPTLEPRAPNVGPVLSQLQTLSNRYGRDRIIWRYDPILIGSRHDTSYHVHRFAELAQHIAPLAARCVVSFLDRYPSTIRELDRVTAATGETFEAPSLPDRSALASELLAICRAMHLDLSACCEPDLLPDIPRARCIDPDLIHAFTAMPKGVFRDAPTRKGCGCVLARDIGAYHTCAHGCVYCYACESPERALDHARRVDMHANTLGPCDIQVSEPDHRSRQLPLLDTTPSVSTNAHRRRG
jgi:hypothetical protein